MINVACECLKWESNDLSMNIIDATSRWPAYKYWYSGKLNLYHIYRRQVAYLVVTLETQSVGRYRGGLLIQCGHPWDTISRGGLLIQCGHPETQPVGCYRGDLLIQCGYPWYTTSWLLNRGDLLIQWKLYIVVTLGTQPVGCYTEVVCLYSGTCI